MFSEISVIITAFIWIFFSFCNFCNWCPAHDPCLAKIVSQCPTGYWTAQMLPILMNWRMNSFKLWIIHEGLCSQDPTSSDILKPKRGCWVPQMRSFIVVSKWTLNLTLFPRIPLFSHLGAKTAKRTTFGQSDRPPTNQVVKTSAPSFVLALLHLSPHGAVCPQVLFSWSLLGHEFLLVFQTSKHQQLWRKAYQLITQSKKHEAS